VTDHLIAPHGGVLKNLIVDDGRAAELKKQSRDWSSWDLTPRQLCDLEMLMSGAYSPLESFLGKADYESVCENMRLADGTLWPIPVVLDLPEDVASDLGEGASVALRDPEGTMLAVLHVEEKWTPDRNKEVEQVYGTTDTKHPGVAQILGGNPVYVSGRLEGVEAPTYYDYRELRRTPAEVRAEFAKLGWRKVVAFQTRNPMHRAHFELTVRAATESGANVLVHPVVGMTKPGDVDHYTRVRCYEAVAQHYPRGTAMLSLLPLAMRMAGPREAVWHAIIRKNHGCTHFIVGRDHAGPGADSKGEPFYGPYDAQEMLRSFEGELGVEMVPFMMMVYVEEKDQYFPVDQVPDGARTLNISGTELRDRLQKGLDIPSWFTFPEVATELRRSYPPRAKQGFTVFFTGLSGSGKSTIANALMVKMLEMGGRPVTLLDGDLVRKHLSSELGFSKEHRDINIRRIGWTAALVTKNGGIALCAPIAPYDSVRKEVRSMVEPNGGFVLVHVATTLELCEERDRKGLYAKARAGVIKEFTGISDPYETPADAEIVIDTADFTPDEAAQEIILYLEREGYIGEAE
jgi:sulfate adenylyltransferase